MTSQQLDLNARFVHWGEYDVMYARVAASGHRYAQLALGVLSSEGSIAGAAATSFLQSTVEATGGDLPRRIECVYIKTWLGGMLRS